MLTFADEFNSAALDQNKWAKEYGFDTYCMVDDPPPGGVPSYCNRSNNDEKEWYVDDAPRLENGILKLVAKKNDCSGDNLPDRNYLPYTCENFPYLSGMVSTHDRFSQLYGYFEARIKVLNARALAGFWLIPQLPPAPSPDVGLLAAGD
jgi:beta-glucanase (GH16 family)